MDKAPINEDEKKKAEALEKLKQQKVAVVNIEEIAEAEARKAADAYMTESKAKIKGPLGFFKKMWKHTYFDEFYRQRQVTRASKQITETGNIYAGRKIEAVNDKIAREAIAERFASEYEETLSKGEDKKILDKNDPEATTTRGTVKKLITDYATKTIDKATFDTEKKKLVNSLKNQDLLKGANTYADNLFEIAETARVAVEHGAKMEELDFDTNLIIGKAKSSLKTEAKFGKVDKAVDWMKKSRFGRYVSPAVISTTLGIAYSVSVGAGTKILRSKAAAYGTFGAAVGVSALVTGLNERQRLALEKKQVELESAEGGVGEKKDKKREKMKEFEYEKIKSTDLENNLRSMIFEKDKDGKEVRKKLEEQDIAAILSTLRFIGARRSLNETKGIDLISYSNPGSVEKERTDLDLLVAKIKAELKEKLGNGEFKNVLPVGEKYEDYLKNQIEIEKNKLLGGEKGIDAQDKAFRKYRNWQVAKKVGMTVAIGLFVGASAQEGAAWLQEHVKGLAEGLLGQENYHAIIQTPLEYLRGVISGHPSHTGMENAIQDQVGGITINHPEGTEILQNNDGTSDIMQGGKVIFHGHLDADSTGAFDQASIDRLGEAGIIANSTHNIIDSTEEVTTTPDDWVDKNPDATTYITRQHLGNDTPMYGRDENGEWILHKDPITGKVSSGADLNELRTYWVGENGFDANGDYAMKIDMTNEGSFQGETSVMARDEMAKGNLMALLSVSKGTQNMVIEIPINPDGTFTVDPDSEIGKMLYTTDANGHAVYTGAFIEVARQNGVTEDGQAIMQILGTHEGADHANNITEIIDTHEDIATNNISVPIDTQPPMYIPIHYRTPLGPVAFKKKQEEEKKKTGGEPISEPVPVSSVDQKEPIGNIEPTPELEENKPLNEISTKEYDDLQNDLKMLNAHIQGATGIVVLSKSDFKSEYGQKRYDELKSIQGGDKPITFNKTELQSIGDEMETYLVNSKKEKPFKDKENIGKVEDFLKKGTEFESEYFKYKVISLNDLGNPKVEKTDKETGKMEVVTITMKKLKEDLEWSGISGADIKITKIGTEDLSGPIKIKKLKEENLKLQMELAEVEKALKTDSSREVEAVALENRIKENEKEQLKLAA